MSFFSKHDIILQKHGTDDTCAFGANDHCVEIIYLFWTACINCFVCAQVWNSYPYKLMMLLFSSLPTSWSHYTFIAIIFIVVIIIVFQFEAIGCWCISASTNHHLLLLPYLETSSLCDGPRNWLIDWYVLIFNSIKSLQASLLFLVPINNI